VETADCSIFLAGGRETSVPEPSVCSGNADTGSGVSRAKMAVSERYYRRMSSARQRIWIAAQPFIFFGRGTAVL